MKPMKAGKLKHLLTFRKDLGTLTDATGSPKTGYVTIRQTWGAITPMLSSGRELFQGSTVTADMTHLIEIRYRGDTPLDPSMQCLFGNRIFEIGAVVHTEEAQRQTFIAAKERLS